MWISKNEFDPYGYFKEAYIKGKYEELQSNQCYKILDNDQANSVDQFQITPIDENGKVQGPPVIKTAGNVMYSIWTEGQYSKAFNISDTFIK